MSYMAQQVNPVDLINETLRGSVVDTLRLFLPDLAPYSNEEAFNVILNSPEMAQRSFGAFRDHPEAFAGVLRGPENQLVAADDEPLSCGRTLSQVVALVVQAVAKRYFRTKLARRTVTPATETGLVGKVAQLFTGPRQPEPAAKPTTSQADRLFLAMRDHLLFEWQLRLIPHYVGLPVALVQALGARLLEFREIEDIQWMVRNGQPPLEPSIRRAESAAPAPAQVSDAAIEAEARQIVPDLEIAPLNLPEGVSAQRFVGAVLSKVNPTLARWLARETQLNPRQLALMLIRAYEALPPSDFQRFGASLPASEEALRFLNAAKAARFGVDTSPIVTGEFSRNYQAKIKPMI